jgi:hypothetical protein
MITPAEMTKAVFILDAARILSATEGQALVWHELVTDAVPHADNEDLMAAVKKACQRQAADMRSWFTVGDLIAGIKAQRRTRVEADERRRGQIESGRGGVTHIDVARLMADARKGLPPDEVGRRARERAEGKAGDGAK